MVRNVVACSPNSSWLRRAVRRFDLFATALDDAPTMLKNDERPGITVTSEDLSVLSELVREAIAAGRYVSASRLADELHRAHIVRGAEVSADCLTLHVPGSYLEERSGAIHDVTLVTSGGRRSLGMISVLSSVGTALLGLSVGQRMSWLDSQGTPRAVRLLEVRSGKTAF